MHYTTLTSRVGPDDMVLVDAAAEYAGYKADITRTFPARRQFTTRQRDVYQIVWDASRETIAQIRPGVPHARLNETTRRVLANGLKSLHLIRDDDELNHYYFYNVSHYIGLDTHDVGGYGELEPGMVLTVEPGLYIDAEALGIRIEDDIVVTETGHEVLSADIPVAPDDVVAWMSD
jgi:Xaa-Pro aminopeptidase